MKFLSSNFSSNTSRSLGLSKLKFEFHVIYKSNKNISSTVQKPVSVYGREKWYAGKTFNVSWKRVGKVDDLPLENIGKVRSTSSTTKS